MGEAYIAGRLMGIEVELSKMNNNLESIAKSLEILAKEKQRENHLRYGSDDRR